MHPIKLPRLFRADTTFLRRYKPEADAPRPAVLSSRKAIALWQLFAHIQAALKLATEGVLIDFAVMLGEKSIELPRQEFMAYH